jgi:hypothetical protein
MSTSNEGDTAFNYVFCFFVEIKAIGADTGMNGSSIKEAFDHFKEGGSSGEVETSLSVKDGDAFANVVDHG